MRARTATRLHGRCAHCAQLSRSQVHPKRQRNSRRRSRVGEIELCGRKRKPGSMIKAQQAACRVRTERSRQPDFPPPGETSRSATRDPASSEQSSVSMLLSFHLRPQRQLLTAEANGHDYGGGCVTSAYLRDATSTDNASARRIGRIMSALHSTNARTPNAAPT